MTEETWPASAELHRIEEDCEHSGKSHYNAGSFWSALHFVLGIPMSVLATAASIDAFSASPDLAGYFAGGAAVLGAVQTFVNPAEKVTKHRAAGSEYMALRNQARRFREFAAPTLPTQEQNDRTEELALMRDNLNRVSPAIPRCAYWLAKKDIDGGLAIYRVDSTGG